MEDWNVFYFMKLNVPIPKLIRLSTCCRFMMSFNKVISSFGHNQILLVWKSIHTFLTDTKPGLVNGSGAYCQTGGHRPKSWHWMMIRNILFKVALVNDKILFIIITFYFIFYLLFFKVSASRFYAELKTIQLTFNSCSVFNIYCISVLSHFLGLYFR